MLNLTNFWTPIGFNEIASLLALHVNEPLQWIQVHIQPHHFHNFEGFLESHQIDVEPALAGVNDQNADFWLVRICGNIDEMLVLMTTLRSSCSLEYTHKGYSSKYDVS